jgi:hypothetical protein
MTTTHPGLPPQVADAEARQEALARMKRRATGLLILMAVVFAITLALEPAHPWLGYVRATAEAGMIGGIADWFAITALFRRPLNLPIPHTAIIPTRKDRIGRTLGNFVQHNFLTEQVLGPKVRALAPSRRARWSGDSPRWPTARWRTRRSSPSWTAGSSPPCCGWWSSTGTRSAASSPAR